MIERFATFVRPLLEQPVVRHTRRNHGLEHATIHLLSGRIRGLRMAGRSTNSGFVLIGEAPTDQVERAVHEALRRMKNGEHHLAIHPNCGTNLVTTGFMTSVAGVLGLSGSNRRDMLNRLPVVMMLMIVALLASQPIGMSLQRHITTDGDPGDLEIVSITRREVRTPLGGQPMTMHRIVTRTTR